MTGIPLSPAEHAAALVEQLFAAPADPATWRRFLGELCAVLGDDMVALLLGELGAPGHRAVLGHGVDLGTLGPADLEPHGPHPSPDELPVGRAMPVATDDVGFVGSHLYREHLAKCGVPPGPGLHLPLFRNENHVTGALFVLSRDRSWQPRPEDTALLELLAPYISRAVEAGIRLHLERTRASALLRALQNLHLGVVLLDGERGVSFANESALEMLSVSDAGTRPAQLEHARDALASLLRRESGESSESLEYPHPADGRPLSVVMAPLRWGQANDTERRRFATALFLSDPYGPPAPSGARLRQLYGLSPGEARLAEQLAAGLTLQEAAEKLEIRVNTARGVLRSVFEKTGTHRQSSLVRLILSGPGQLRPKRRPPGGSPAASPSGH